MVSIDKLTRKIIQLDEYLEVIGKVASIPEKDFLKDKIVIGSAKYYLQVSIKCCLDITNHIIAAERFRAPEDYADSFAILAENDIYASELCQKLMQMAKFRNRLVHLYGEIDNHYVYKFLHNDLDDITSYRKIIMQRYKLV